ncbi:MAG TPA: protein kinase, partial [Thermoanaerobaculia bacterium]|nr:protein kinase [Thermoanaerobaculia bacterium]
MTLAAGVRLGPYEILTPLGAGGMGEVYKARDTKLRRDVAIKVLPDGLARDPDALARFEREAHAVAALNHPNILSIHDFGNEGGVAFAVMELLEGETLREIVAAGVPPQRKAVEWGRQIAAGLAAAHGKGIVHRDLKPDNVFVTHDGRVKILDFGLAKPKVRGRDGGSDEHSPTVSAYTEPGTVMGTVGYMSPEQVKGQDVDQRADIFAFGAVFYEMLTGRRAFQRETAAETMTAILREEAPELAESGRKIPPGLDRIVRHCLEKKPEQRFQSASDIAFALEDLSGPVSGPTLTPPTGSRSHGPVLVAGACAAAALVLGALAGYRLRRTPEAGAIRVHPLTFSGRDSDPAASPDGKLIAFTSWRDGKSRIWIKQLAGGGEAPLTAGPDRRPRFSPDGLSILFLRDLGNTQAVYRVGLVGGDPRKVVDDAFEADWAPDGKSIFYFRLRETPSVASEFRRFDLESGKDDTLAKLDDLAIYSARASPDGRSIAFSAGNYNRNSASWRLLRMDVATGKISRMGPERLGNALGGVAWSGDGSSLFYIQSASVMGDISGSGSQVFRLDVGTGRSHPVLWADGLAAINASTGEVSRSDVLSAGRLVFAERLRRQNLRESAIVPGAVAAPPRIVTDGSSIDRQPTYSPDGKRILFSSNRSGNLDLWTLETATGALRQVTDDGAQDWDPAFTVDGRHILWDSDRSGHLEVWMANDDGSGARQITQDGVDAENPTETADGKWIVYWSGSPEKRGIWKIRPDGNGAVRLVECDAVGTDVSPDGKYVLYVEQDRVNLRNTVHFIEVDSGRSVPLTIAVRYSLSSPEII